MLVHIGYTVFAYLTFYCNPTLKLLTAIPFMVLACLHAICGMLTVFLQSDGTRLDLYPRQNLEAKHDNQAFPVPFHESGGPLFCRCTEVMQILSDRNG